MHGRNGAFRVAEWPALAPLDRFWAAKLRSTGLPSACQALIEARTSERSFALLQGLPAFRATLARSTLLTYPFRSPLAASQTRSVNCSPPRCLFPRFGEEQPR